MIFIEIIIYFKNYNINLYIFKDLIKLYNELFN